MKIKRTEIWKQESKRRELSQGMKKKKKEMHFSIRSGTSYLRKEGKIARQKGQDRTYSKVSLKEERGEGRRTKIHVKHVETRH